MKANQWDALYMRVYVYLLCYKELAYVVVRAGAKIVGRLGLMTQVEAAVPQVAFLGESLSPAFKDFQLVLSGPPRLPRIFSLNLNQRID